MSGEREFDPDPVTCPHCDFGSGQRGMDRCARCDGIGSVFRVAGKTFLNTRDGYVAAVAAMKSQADETFLDRCLREANDVAARMSARLVVDEEKRALVETGLSEPASRVGAAIACAASVRGGEEEVNRSDEELAMRRTIAKWGRVRWPDARLVHELVVGASRIDMAFIGPEYLIGIEIKSSRDTLDRLRDQHRVFSAMLPFTICALAPIWRDQAEVWPRIFVEGETIDNDGIHWYKADRSVTAQMLHLLWAAELRNVAARTRVSHGSRSTRTTMIGDLARALTGDEIVREVCRELRARDAFPRCDGHPPSDPPIVVEAKAEKQRIVTGTML